MTSQQTLRRLLVPHLSPILNGKSLRDRRRAFAAWQRRISGEARRLQYFHQVDDPYSHLAAQTLAPLLARYNIELEVHLVGPPPSAAAPARANLESFSRKDAGDIAPSLGLEFPEFAVAPDRRSIEIASGILVTAIASNRFIELAPRVGAALHNNDSFELEALATECAPADLQSTRIFVEKGNNLREKRGHYLGAMFYDAPEWYWGVDRLYHLEERLEQDGLRREGSDAGPIIARPHFGGRDAEVSSDHRLTLEFFPSLRSPYSYIVTQRVLALAERLPVDLVLRPVLPMVMRGLPVPLAKQRYIVFDTKREADAANVDFGRICDPVGEPVERGFSLFGWAREQGRGKEFLLEFMRAAWAEGMNLAQDQALSTVVERSGLDWNQAQFDPDGWRPELEANREALFAAGLWGVPSMRLPRDGEFPEFATWGQDRVWLIEREIRRRCGAATS